MTLRERLRAAATEALASSPRSQAPSLCIYGERFTEGCCDGWRVKCYAPAVVPSTLDPGPRTLDASACASCAERLAPDALHIGAVITARNEGDEVRRTVESLARSVLHARLTIVVIDDGSEPAVSSQLAACSDNVHNVHTVHVVRTSGVGIGRARNLGWQLARAAGCHVVTFHDAHMRFRQIAPDDPCGVPGGLETLAAKALREDCIVCAGSAGLRISAGHDEPAGGRYWGCNLWYNARDGLQAKWDHVSRVPDAEWLRSACMMGAGYVMSARTAERLEAATGHLWDDTAGRWGFSEQALSVKAFLMGIPIWFSRDVVFRHLYRSSNPLPKAGQESWRNVCRATAVLFGREIFDERFRAFCVARLGSKVVEQITAEAWAGRNPMSWALDPERVFTELVREGDPDAKEGLASRVPFDFAQGPELKAAAVAGSRPSQLLTLNSQLPLVTVCLLNYKRPENIGPILDALARQTVSVQVFLWDNGPAGQELTFSADGAEPQHIARHPLVKLYAKPGRNAGCWPRWPLLATADTEYVCTLDDDLTLKDERVLADAVAACREECPDGIVGPFGWEHVEGKSYLAARHLHAGKAGSRRCDVVKGRFMLMHRAVLAAVPLAAPSSAEGAGRALSSSEGLVESLSFRCDDIIVSLYVAHGVWGRHVLPARLAGRFKELKTHGVALEAQPGHYHVRDRALNAVRLWLLDGTEAVFAGNHA